MSPRTHGPLQRPGSEASGGWLAQGPEGGVARCYGRPNGTSPRRRCWATRRAHLPLCRSALEAPRPSPSARGFYGAGSAGAGTMPATLSGFAEGSGAGCNSELGFCAMSGKSGGRVGGLTGGGSGGSQTRVPANGEIHPSQHSESRGFLSPEKPGRFARAGWWVEAWQSHGTASS
jgi:hypothetical protein